MSRLTILCATTTLSKTGATVRIEGCCDRAAMLFPTFAAVTFITIVISLATQASEPLNLVLLGAAFFAIATLARRSLGRTVD